MDMQVKAKHTKILAVIDTEVIKLKYPKPSQNWRLPTNINTNNDFYTLCFGTNQFDEQENSCFRFSTNNNHNKVTFRGVSIDNNADDAVIIYDVTSLDKHVFRLFELEQITRYGAVQPDPQAAVNAGIPPIHTSINFNHFSSKVKIAKKARLKVSFGLYRLDSDIQKQLLFGYYTWYLDICIR